MADTTEHAFGEFYRHHARSLWTYAYRVTGNAADADDVTQEAFIRVLTADLPGEEDMRKYLFRVAGNLMADRWRRSAREHKMRQHIHDEPAQQVTTGDEDVARTFAELKSRDRALLWLAYVEGEDHAGIAQSLQVARGSVKVLLSRARARLRDLLASRGLTMRT